MKFDSQFLTQNDLLRRHWNVKLIGALLGEPDKFKPNPWYRSAPHIRLFNRLRVEQAEASECFKSHLVLHEKRAAAARRALETKQKKTIAFAEHICIDIPRLSLDELKERAARNYNNHHARREDWHDDETRWTDAEQLSPWAVPHAFRDRICVNYLRHACTRYDYLLAYLTRKIGRAEAHRVLFGRIMDVIAEVYPCLAEEARAQYLRRFAAEAA
jgi:hypothetical protein